ncbi:MAG: hypothetical protein RR189_01340 [Bacilli bacterium]
MDNLKVTLILGVIVFIVVFLVDYFLILKRKVKKITKPKEKEKFKIISIMEIEYLISKFALDKKKLNINYCIVCIALLNALIISFVSSIIMLIPWALPWQLLVGFTLLFILIYAIYELFGRHLVKKGWRK